MRKFLVLVALLALVAIPVMGQVRTGNIYGKVVDASSGQPLPGVAVTLTGDKIAPMTTVTSAEGNFRFLSLPPGTYTIKAELQGFKTVVRKGIRVVVGSDVSIVLKMQEGAIKEEITVTAAAPVVDTRKATVAANVTRETLQELPTARDPWVILQLAPGVMVDRVNVGGSESGQQSTFAGRGAGQRTAQWSIDGTNITDEAAQGASPMYYDYDAFEEIQIQTAANDITAVTGGIQINFVTRRGGNRVSGGARVYWTGEKYQAKLSADRGDFATVSTPMGKKIPLGNKIKSITDYGFNLGGPLIKDRLWFWGSYGVQDIDKYNFVGARDDTWLENINAKLNAQVGNHRLEFAYTWANKEKEGRSRTGGYLDAHEATFHQTGPTNVYKIQDEFTIGNDLFVSLKLGHVAGAFELMPYGGKSTEGDTITFWDVVTNVRWGSNYYYWTDRPQYHGTFLVDYFAENFLGATHEFKVGVDYKYAMTDSMYQPGAQARLANGHPYEVRLYRGWDTKYYSRRLGFFLQDTVNLGRVTLNLGARYDIMKAGSLSKDVQGTNHNLFRNIGGKDYNWAPVKTLAREVPFKWNVFSPRLGLTYDITGDGKTLLKLNVSLYGETIPAGYGDKMSVPYAIARFYWFDDGDAVPEPNELVPRYVISFMLDPDIDLLFDKNLSPPKTLEVLVGLEKEIVPNFGVGANFIYRRYFDLNWNVPWMWDTSTDTLVRPTEESYWYQAGEIDGHIWWDTQPWLLPFWWNNGLIILPDYTTKHPDFYVDYKALELVFNKRLSNKWMLNGSVTFQDSKRHYLSRKAYIDPTNHEPEDMVNNTVYAPVSRGSGATNVHMFARWMAKFGFLYQLPYDFNISGVLIAREGYIFPVHKTDYTAEKQYDWWGFPSVLTKKYGSEHLPTFWMLNFRLEKKIQISERGNVYLTVDLFNATNNAISLGKDANEASPNFGKDLQVTNPRLLRFGARFEF